MRHKIAAGLIFIGLIVFIYLIVRSKDDNNIRCVPFNEEPIFGKNIDIVKDRISSKDGEVSLKYVSYFVSDNEYLPINIDQVEWSNNHLVTKSACVDRSDFLEKSGDMFVYSSSTFTLLGRKKTCTVGIETPCDIGNHFYLSLQQSYECLDKEKKLVGYIVIQEVDIKFETQQKKIMTLANSIEKCSSRNLCVKSKYMPRIQEKNEERLEIKISDDNFAAIQFSGFLKYTKIDSTINQDDYINLFGQNLVYNKTNDIDSELRLKTTCGDVKLLLESQEDKTYFNSIKIKDNENNDLDCLVRETNDPTQTRIEIHNGYRCFTNKKFECSGNQNYKISLIVAALQFELNRSKDADKSSFVNKNLTECKYT